MPDVAVIACPDCGHQADEVMPTDACRCLYACTGCGVTLKPRHGDCGVFCSYGNIACPPVQLACD